MEKRGNWKGRVTPLSSVLPPEEARKAAKKVAEAISDKERELDHLNQFVADNTSIINLVKGLPDELHHDIMVPFGKAAFFPGRLIHTNEFMVLLGEGYYAERTSKQTVDILRRRGKTLDSQVDALKGMMKNLQLEASFFNSTADEAEEGLVEIREEFIEEDPMENTLETVVEDLSMKNVEDVPKKTQLDELTRDEENCAHTDDKGFAKMMSKLDELEREEEEEEAAAAAAAASASSAATVDADGEELAQKISGLNEWVSNDQIYNCRQKVTEKLKASGILRPKMGSSDLQSSLKGEFPGKKDSVHSLKERSAEKSDIVASQVNMGTQTVPKSPSKASLKTSKSDAVPKISRPTTDSLKAFSGSIIEHSDNLPTNPIQTTLSQPSSSQASKPVSRFKMQRRAWLSSKNQGFRPRCRDLLIQLLYKSARNGRSRNGSLMWQLFVGGMEDYQDDFSIVPCQRPTTYKLQTAQLCRVALLHEKEDPTGNLNPL